MAIQAMGIAASRLVTKSMWRPYTVCTCISEDVRGSLRCLAFLSSDNTLDINTVLLMDDEYTAYFILIILPPAATAVTHPEPVYVSTRYQD
jgi:hypothetical protein